MPIWVSSMGIAASLYGKYTNKQTEEKNGESEVKEVENDEKAENFTSSRNFVMHTHIYRYAICLYIHICHTFAVVVTAVMQIKQQNCCYKQLRPSIQIATEAHMAQRRSGRKGNYANNKGQFQREGREKWRYEWKWWL